MSTKLTVNGRSDQFDAPLRNREKFATHGSLKGEPGRGFTLGMLPNEHTASACRATYAVMSYATPIAWFVPADAATDADRAMAVATVDDGVWMMPDVRYSVSTSKQQGRIRCALMYL